MARSRGNERRFSTPAGGPVVAEDVQRLPAPTMPGGRRQRQSQPPKEERAKNGICEPELFPGRWW